jgi:hypothetical protein
MNVKDNDVDDDLVVLEVDCYTSKGSEAKRYEASLHFSEFLGVNGDDAMDFASPSAQVPYLSVTIRYNMT